MKIKNWQKGRNSLQVCMLSHFSCVRLFAILWTVACQAPLSMGFSSALPCLLETHISMEWVGLPSSRGLSLLRDWNPVSYVSCIGRWVLYHHRHMGSPRNNLLRIKSNTKKLGPSDIFYNSASLLYYLLPLTANISKLASPSLTCPFTFSKHFCKCNLTFITPCLWDCTIPILDQPASVKHLG